MAFIQTGWILISGFLILLFCLNVRLTAHGAASLLAVLLTLLCGGVGGFVWLFTDFTWSGFFQYVCREAIVTIARSSG